jgi:hypothetical protein
VPLVRERLKPASPATSEKLKNLVKSEPGSREVWNQVRRVCELVLEFRSPELGGYRQKEWIAGAVAT